MTPFYRFAARGAIIPFLKMVSRQTVSGLENIPREGGFIAEGATVVVDEQAPVSSR